MNIDLTPILQAVIAIIAALVTYKLIPWIKARTTNEQQAYIKATIKTLVFAAEQIYGAGKGKEKYAYVVNALKDRGFTVDPAAIEAAVNENFSHITDVEITDERVETMDVADMTDDQLRAVLPQMGATQEQINACATRAELEALIESFAKDALPYPPTFGGAE
ncbi:MAG: phage holin, LLH family [Eubacteriales bacterium]|nr:phage holin, LLH family [Eubacteriales bacterium]MDD3881871.1 phage holin, LLH family [Eubacteriales bacterium]MDD4512884.1 phage holin, LLH family [Eubacteriales bacterium]